MFSVFDVANSRDKAAEIIRELEQLSNIFRALLAEQANEHKLSSLQVQILLQLYFEGKKESGTNAALLARTLKLNKATISIALKSMEEKRLINRIKDTADQRAQQIKLTEWGKEVAHIAGFYPEPLRKVLAPIANREKELLLKNIRGITSKLNEAISP